MDTRTCKKCGETKALTDFAPYSKAGSRYRRHQCNPCLRDVRQRYIDANGDMVRETARRSKLRRRYGMELERFLKLAEEQANLCAICRLRPPFAVDHCHDSGEVRGLLCRQCNNLLGMAGDDPDVLRRAIDYLLRIPVGVGP